MVNEVSRNRIFYDSCRIILILLGKKEGNRKGKRKEGGNLPLLTKTSQDIRLKDKFR